MARVEDERAISLRSVDAARLIGVTPRTLRRWRADGVGPRYARTGKAGSQVLYRVSWIEEWLDSRAVGGDR